MDPLLSSTFFFKILYHLQWILKIYVKDCKRYVKDTTILFSWLQKSNLLNTSKMISLPILWPSLFNRMQSLTLKYLCLCVDYIVVEQHCPEQNCLWSFYIFLMEESFHNHMPKIFSYLKTRTKRLYHLRNDYTVICTQSSVSFCSFFFEIYPMYIVCFIFLWRFDKLKGNVGIS